MKKGKHVGGGPTAPAAPAATADPRFARVQSDPRFRRMPKDEAKASIDKRFSVMFKDRKFAEPAAADKRGRAKKKEEKHLLHRYYKAAEGQEEAGAVKKGAKKNDDDSEEEEEDDDDEEEHDEEKEEEEEEEEEEEQHLGLDSEEEDEKDSEEEDEEEESGSDEESSSSSSSSDSEVEEVNDSRDEEAIPTAPGAERRRFAIMNMDWEHVKAVDLLMLMRSFQPKGGNVECVNVYPSDFGIEQLKKEEVHGPSAIFEEDDEDEDKEVNMEKLRAYEKNKLKYYYAVVECDSKETANHLYTQCDGLEFERTSNTLDLRFIPDEMTFTRAPRDVAREVQDGYKAPDYETRALQHSTVKLTWDDDEPTRVKALRKKFNAEELNEMDFRAYLASESSEEELGGEEEESPSSPERGEASKSKKDKYRSLLLGDAAEMELPGQRKKKGDVDMEVTFHTGLSELSEKLMKKKEAKKRGDETVWEAYLRKKKEKKSQRKRSKNAKGSDDDYTSEEDAASPREADPFFTHDDTGFDDPFFVDAGEFPDEAKAKKSSKKKEDTERLKKREEKEQQKKEEEKSKAELELLLMDDQGAQVDAARGFNLKSKKKKEKKKKKNKDDPQEEEEDKLATAELTDPRFATLFTDHRYAVDPDNSQFWKSDSHRKIMSASAKRKMQEQSESGGAAASAAPEPANDGSQDRKRKAELSSLVRSLKRKAGKK